MSGVAVRPIKLPDRIRAELQLAWSEDNDNPALSGLRAVALTAFSENKKSVWPRDH